jgi:predicted DNA-binding protein
VGLSPGGPLRGPASATVGAMAAKKKASGVNIPEAQRSGVQVKLRLPPEVAEDLDALAARWNLTRSGTVARLLERMSQSYSTTSDPSERVTPQSSEDG